MKRLIAIALAGALGLTGLIVTNSNHSNVPVLKVANWAEYIDDGSESGTPMIERFEAWYKEQTGNPIRVEYSIADDNEILYNLLRMGDTFDLICPSEYMLMKLAVEGYLQKLPDSFYDSTKPENHYIRNVSPFILETFENNVIESIDTAWKEYAAGYMWGTTGFVYNPDVITEEEVKTWDVYKNPKCYKRITAKNNIRDTYFVGLAMYHDSKLRSLQQQYNDGLLTLREYNSQLGDLMNDVSHETMNNTKNVLSGITNNLYGFETDEGKQNTVSGKVAVNYQWSGDAVAILDEAEGLYEEDLDESFVPLYLNYCIPETVSNLWFDGWALTKDCQNVETALMFINFLSIPENVVANMSYIGYTSCIGNKEVFDTHVVANYGAEDDDETKVAYDLNYYFNPNYNRDDPTTKSEDYIFYTPLINTKRQLFAQYPQETDLARCVAMRYFDADANMRANSMWSDITFF